MPHEIFQEGDRNEVEREEMHTPLSTRMSRRAALRSLAAFAVGASVADVFGQENVERAEEDVPVEVVDEGKEKMPFRLHIFALDEKEKPKQSLEESALRSIPAGRHKLFVASARPNTFLEMSYEVLDREGNVQWNSGKTHVPQIVDIPEGGRLRIRRFPPIPITGISV